MCIKQFKNGKNYVNYERTFDAQEGFKWTDSARRETYERDGICHPLCVRVSSFLVSVCPSAEGWSAITSNKIINTNPRLTRGFVIYALPPPLDFRLISMSPSESERDISCDIWPSWATNLFPFLATAATPAERSQGTDDNTGDCGFFQIFYLIYVTDLQREIQACSLLNAHLQSLRPSPP
ncbi:hypothetical protein J6590_101958 [Homalodisca vitripennis]|nr:hypothetical protein J6590_007061 [Homalodisca vitripennis]KAG8314035.1 hypothetical protein J6590_101958 [Homalodisca vitripennis]